MLKLVKYLTVKDWPVVIGQPSDEGVITKHNITLDFEIVPTNEFQALAALGDVAIVKKVIKGWSGIADESGSELEFNDETLTQIATVPYIVKGAIGAYLDAQQGVTPTKN